MYNKMLREQEKKGGEREKGGRKKGGEEGAAAYGWNRSGRLLWWRLAMRGGEGGPDKKLHLWSQCPHRKLGAIYLSVPTSCPRPSSSFVISA